MHGPEREQCMVDVVVGENDQWTFGAQALRQHQAATSVPAATRLRK
jgi:hypothetical protein